MSCTHASTIIILKGIAIGYVVLVLSTKITKYTVNTPQTLVALHGTKCGSLECLARLRTFCKKYAKVKYGRHLSRGTGRKLSVST